MAIPPPDTSKTLVYYLRNPKPFPDEDNASVSNDKKKFNLIWNIYFYDDGSAQHVLEYDQNDQHYTGILRNGTYTKITKNNNTIYSYTATGWTVPMVFTINFAGEISLQSKLNPGKTYNFNDVSESLSLVKTEDYKNNLAEFATKFDSNLYNKYNSILDETDPDHGTMMMKQLRKVKEIWSELGDTKARFFEVSVFINSYPTGYRPLFDIDVTNADFAILYFNDYDYSIGGGINGSQIRENNKAIFSEIVPYPMITSLRFSSYIIKTDFEYSRIPDNKSESELDKDDDIISALFDALNIEFERIKNGESERKALVFFTTRWNEITDKYPSDYLNFYRKTYIAMINAYKNYYNYLKTLQSMKKPAHFTDEDWLAIKQFK